MAQPPLEYQIEHARRILLCRTIQEAEGFAYEITEALKGPSTVSTLRLNTKIFELLGYVPAPGQPVIVFLMEGDQPIELLPVTDGTFLYAPHDSSVTRKTTVQELRRQVTPARGVPGRWGYIAGPAIVLAGFVGFLVFLLSRLSGFSDALTRFQAPGRCEMALQAGSHTIYWESTSMFRTWPDLSCSVVSTSTERPVDVSTSWVTTKYSTGSRRGVSKFTFEIREPGTYLVEATYPQGKGGEGETLAVGRSAGWGILATVFGCLAILGISLPAGILLIVRTALGRRSLP